MSATRGNFPARPKQHIALCQICKHDKREEIEQSYKQFESAPKLAEKFNVSDDSIYRHAEYFGLDELRVADTERVLKNVIARGFAQNKTISPQIAIAAVQELHKITGKHKAPETNPADVEREDLKRQQAIEMFNKLITARQEQQKHLTINQIIIQVREEWSNNGLEGLLRLLPDVTEE